VNGRGNQQQRSSESVKEEPRHKQAGNGEQASEHAAKCAAPRGFARDQLLQALSAEDPIVVFSDTLAAEIA